MQQPYGYELILDLHKCDVSKFNRTEIKRYFKEVCDVIDMQRCELHFWDDVGVPVKERQTSPHTKGTSAVQFILTSSIVIHTLDELGKVFINIFSCKEFNVSKAACFTKEFFTGTIIRSNKIERL